MHGVTANAPPDGLSGLQCFRASISAACGSRKEVPHDVEFLHALPFCHHTGDTGICACCDLARDVALFARLSDFECQLS